MDPARFIESGALDGAANMRIDAGMLEDCILDGLPRLRLYAWSRPTLSLGYFQKLEEVAEAGAALEVEVVKRPTGGGAILHHDELTFSLALPMAHPAARCGVNESYLALSKPLLGVLRGLGVQAAFRGEQPARKAANCFSGAACPDLVVAGRKVFGSAQRRKEKALLMHGSLLFSVDEALWKRVFGPRLGEGFAGIGHADADWAGLLKKAYAEALNLDFSTAGQAENAVLT